MLELTGHAITHCMIDWLCMESHLGILLYSFNHIWWTAIIIYRTVNNFAGGKLP